MTPEETENAAAGAWQNIMAGKGRGIVWRDESGTGRYETLSSGRLQDIAPYAVEAVQTYDPDTQFVIVDEQTGKWGLLTPEIPPPEAWEKRRGALFGE